MYPEEIKAANRYDVPTTESSPSVRDDIRNLYLAQASAEKRDAELSERANQLAERISRLERTIGE